MAVAEGGGARTPRKSELDMVSVCCLAEEEGKLPVVRTAEGCGGEGRRVFLMVLMGGG